MRAVLTYILSAAGIVIAVLVVVDQFARAHKKNQLPHLIHNSMLLAGGVLTLLLAGLAVYAFTGTWVPLIIFSSIAGAVLGAAYAWRFKRERETDRMWEALLAEEERQARETAERDPANAAAWARLAQLREKRGDLRGALELFEKACAAEPTQLNQDRLADLREKAAALPPPAQREAGGGE